MPGKTQTKLLSQRMPEALEQSAKTSIIKMMKATRTTDCSSIVVDYKLVRSTSETRKIDEHKYYMQLCMDTRTN